MVGAASRRKTTTCAGGIGRYACRAATSRATRVAAAWRTYADSALVRARHRVRVLREAGRQTRLERLGRSLTQVGLRVVPVRHHGAATNRSKING
jgi:hypothetical protein